MSSANPIPVAANSTLAKQVTDADIEALCISFQILSLSNEGVAPMQVDDPVNEDLCASFQSLTVSTNPIPVADTANTKLAKQVTDADIDALCISFQILSLINVGVAPMQVDDPIIEDLCESFQSLTVFDDDSMEIDDPMDWEPLVKINKLAISA